MTVSASARRQFLLDYRHIRHAEGRGSDDPAYYRELPFRDLSGRNASMWAMRATTYRYFERRILEPIERRMGRPLAILDLGAGNCWMTYRLSLRGHRAVALDIFADDRDGLRAARNYGRPLAVVEAEFDGLPFEPASFDLAVFNASFHYSADYGRTLAAARRCLVPGGAVVILDSPVYRRHADGLRMVAERREQFLKQYGFASDALPSIEFLDEPALVALERSAGVKWEIHRPWYGWKWHLRPWKARLARRRPPSRFWILVGRFRA